MAKAGKLPEVPAQILAESDLDPSQGFDYQSAFSVAVSPHDSRPAEAWARQMYEAAPHPERLFVWYGWKALTARLGPFPSEDHVLGYRIRERRADLIRFSVEWRLGLHCDLVLYLDGSTATLVTFVRTPTRVAKIVWPAVVPLHEVLVPRWLERAAASL